MFPVRLSLKTRLRLGILLLVLGIVVVLAALNLHRELEQSFSNVRKQSLANADLVKSFVLSRVQERQALVPSLPKTYEEYIALWQRIIENDSQLSQLLVNGVGSNGMIMAIYVTDDKSNILAASNPAHAGGRMPQMGSFYAFLDKPLYSRIWETLTSDNDYFMAFPLGALGQSPAGTPQQELFSVRIVTTTLQMREALMPEIVSAAVISLVAIPVSVLLAYVFSRILLRPLNQIGETIDRIAAGDFSADPLKSNAASDIREVVDLQTKLGALDKQVRGARADALQLRGNIDQLLERMEEIILAFDNENRLVLAGRTASRLFSQAPSELTGSSIFDLFPPDSSIGKALLTSINFRKSISDWLVSHATPSGQNLSLLLTIDFNNDRMLMTLRDAESRKELASHLDLSARLAAINRLTGGVAHEIKNPLNAIAIHLEILKTRIPPTDTELQEEVSIIGKEIRRLDRVVKGFLNFTRPVEVSLVSLDLVAIVEEIAALLRPQAKATNVHLVVHHNTPAAFIWADRDLIKQAIHQVTANAIEAMAKGGLLALRINGLGSVVSLEVADRGAGIPENLREKIFQLYFTTKSEGSGIGLAVAFQAVQLMGGTITFTNNPRLGDSSSSGTTFRLKFRAANSPEQLRAAEESATALAAGNPAPSVAANTLVASSSQPGLKSRVAAEKSA